MSYVPNLSLLKKGYLFVYLIILIEVICKFLNYFTRKDLIIHSFYVNYECGIIRRGLFGSVLYFFAKHEFINPFKVQIGFILILIVLLFFIILKQFYRYKIEYYILFASFLILNEIAYNMFFFIDIFLVVFYIFQVFLLNKINNFKIKIIIANITSFLMILCHEVYFIFTFFPILYLLDISSFSKENIKKMLLLLPSLITFLVIGLCFSGHNLDINHIVDSWKVLGEGYSDKIGNLYWTFKTTDEVIMWRIPFFRKNPIYLILFFVNLLIIFLSMLVYLNKNFQAKSKFLFTFLLFQYLAIAFTSLIAIDYVRWFCMANLITIFTLIYVDSNKSFFNIMSFKIPTNFNNYNKFILLFIGLPLGGQWSPIQYMYTMPIKHFFDFWYRLISIFN